MIVRPKRFLWLFRILIISTILSLGGTSVMGAQGTPVPSASDHAATARALNDAFNARDWDAAISLMTPDVELVMVPTGQVFIGLDEARLYLDLWANAFSDASIETTLVVANESTAAMEFTGRGTHDGPLETPAGTIPASGQPVELFFTQFLEFEDGQIARGRLHFDLAALMRQIQAGATPGSAPAQETTPAAAGLVTPDPAECTVEPRSMESLLAISATPGVGTPPVRMQTDGAALTLNVPEGEPADAATFEAVTATIHELVACENAGDLRRAHALVTDNLLRSHEAQQPLTQEERIAAFGGTPVARPADDFGAVRVAEVRMLPDNEVVAVWERQSRFGSMTFVSVLFRQDGRYLVDRHIDVVVVPSGTPPA